MRSPVTPVLDPRDAAAFFAQLEQGIPAFTPELVENGSGSTTALLQVLARYLGTVTQRLNQAPGKNFLAFLETLGISLIPPQPARAPLVFTPLPMAPNGTIPAGTRAGSSPPGAAKPLIFETEKTVAMCAANLVAAVSLWPDRDTFADHTADLAGGRPFTLFTGEQPIEHVVYFAHDNLLAFMGRTIVEIRVSLAPSGNQPLEIRWEHWDGQVWRPFADFDPASPATASQDGTAGLTRSGVIVLRAVCGDSMPTKVSNLMSHWIRGRLTKQLPPDASRVLALADQVQLRTTVDRSLQPGSAGVPIDKALADTSTLDLTKTFFPFGKAPTQDSVFYVVCEEAFSKAGANVTIAFEHVNTPEEDADALGAKYAIDIDNARNMLVQAEADAGEAIANSAKAIVGLDALASPFAIPANAAIGNLENVVGAFSDPNKTNDIAAASDLMEPLLKLLSVGVVYQSIPLPPFSVPDLSATDAAMQAGRDRSIDAIDKARAALGALAQLTPASAVGGVGGTPLLPPPELIWEYWNGTAWAPLILPSNNDADNLLATGQIQFVVPPDLTPFPFDSGSGRAIRARLASGSYNKLEIVTWYDSQAGKTNYYALIEPRPPALRNLALGYTWRSAWKTPEQCLTKNDFLFEDHTPDVARPGTAFAPFHPVADTLPALYLGFDQPLPNDFVSMYFNLTETDGDGPPLVWESWDGAQWQTLKALDDTGELARPGMVSFLVPGVPPRQSATVSAASEFGITTGGPLEAARFVPGNKIVVTSGKNGELATIRSIDQASLTLETPLAGSYTNATVQLAALPRFGASLDWVRARLRQDGAPEAANVQGIYLNAVWARQLQTITGEILGSGLGQPNQTFFFSQFPVLPGERVEVRELDGARAAVEYPILRDDLLSRGFTDDDIRTATDPRTGAITEVWVRWRVQPTLYFSGPDDRDYTIERTRGRILFGSGIQGKLLSPGNSNVRAAMYQAGGGIIGNVAAGTISQMMSGAPARGVTNPRAAESGADGEDVAGVEWRGPQVLRHRGRAISGADYEALAREASPGVALARALPATSANFRPAPGCVTLIVVPQSADPRPQPSYEFRQQIAAYLAERAPASVDARNIVVIGPTYLAVGVYARIAPVALDQARAIKDSALAALARFFHPLTGGRDGHGWPFGRDVYISDVAGLLESLAGVDYVQNLELLVDQIPQGDQVSVPPDRIVVAGDMQIEMEGVPAI